jgi:RNA polymerase sigma-70 factor (ECF subfamily)
MAHAHDMQENPQPGSPVFPDTRWSVVLRAGLEAGGEAKAALERLCRDYWFPLYAFVRRRGYSPEDAEDVTQGFMLHLLEGPLLGRADRERGRFRSFLLGALQHFLAKEIRRQQTIKRGGGREVFSLDAEEGERRFAQEPADEVTPEVQFERSWAFALLERVFARLREEYEQAGRAELFEKLQPYLAGKENMPGYEHLARQVGLSPSGVGVSIHRMRRRYGELLRDEIAQTVSTPQEAEEELGHLMAVVAH